MDRWPEDPRAPKRIEDVLPQVIPVVLPRDQRLSIVLAPGSRLLEIRETMPPKINFERFDAPNRREEFDWRTKEWRDVSRKAFAWE